jgi:hypothetical protein
MNPIPKQGHIVFATAHMRSGLGMTTLLTEKDSVDRSTFYNYFSPV